MRAAAGRIGEKFIYSEACRTVPKQAYCVRLDASSGCSEAGTMPRTEAHMLGWAVVFLIVAIIAAIFGFFGIAAAAAGIAKIIFIIFIILFLISLVGGLMRRT